MTENGSGFDDANFEDLHGFLHSHIKIIESSADPRAVYVISKSIDELLHRLSGSLGSEVDQRLFREVSDLNLLLHRKVLGLDGLLSDEEHECIERMAQKLVAKLVTYDEEPPQECDPE